jgi:hypothetical protein
VINPTANSDNNRIHLFERGIAYLNMMFEKKAPAYQISLAFHHRIETEESALHTVTAPTNAPQIPPKQKLKAKSESIYPYSR